MNPLISIQFITVIACAISSAQAQYTTSDINYNERTVHLLTNALRIDPVSYLSRFSSATNTCARTAAAAQPLYWQSGLSKGSQFQCTSMFNSHGTCFQHDSCPADCPQFGSCNWAKRVWKFYNKLVAIGENIAEGYRSPMAVMDGWLGSEGHCSNLMQPGYSELGTGQVGAFWCQDFGGASNADFAYSEYVSGTHLTPLASALDVNNLWFIAVYNGIRAPSSIWIQVGGVTRGLQLLYGTPNRGVYGYKLENPSILAPNGCTLYFFKAISGNGRSMQRFPQVGKFLVQGLNGCNQNYSL